MTSVNPSDQVVHSSDQPVNHTLPLQGETVVASSEATSTSLLPQPSSPNPEVVGSASDPFTKDQVLSLDKELEFSSVHMTRAAFSAKIIFITIITVILFTMFVAVFYFVFTSRVEKRVVKKSVQDTIETIFADFKIFLSKEQLNALRGIVQTISLPDLSKDDKAAKKHNDWLIRRSFLFLGVGALVLVVVLLVYYFVMRGVTRHAKAKQGGEAVGGVDYPEMGTVFFVAAMGFVGVVIAEFVFLYLIAARYKPLDSYTVRRDLIFSLLKVGLCTGVSCPPGKLCQVVVSKDSPTSSLPTVKAVCAGLNGQGATPAGNPCKY